MKILKKFTINYAGLADGEHFFDFFIDNKFFDFFKYSLIDQAKIEVELKLIKFLDSLELNFSINGAVQVPCDLCLDEFDLPITSNEKINVKIVKNLPDEDDPNLLYKLEGENSINVAESIYELITLSLPMRKVHPQNEDGQSLCNPSMIKYLDQKTTFSENDNESNPVWDELKKLK